MPDPRRAPSMLSCLPGLGDQRISSVLTACRWLHVPFFPILTDSLLASHPFSSFLGTAQSFQSCWLFWLPLLLRLLFQKVSQNSKISSLGPAKQWMQFRTTAKNTNMCLSQHAHTCEWGHKPHYWKVSSSGTTVSRWLFNFLFLFFNCKLYLRQNQYRCDGKMCVFGRLPSTIWQETWATWEGQLSQLSKWSWRENLPNTGTKENCIEQNTGSYCWVSLFSAGCLSILCSFKWFWSSQ